MTTGMPATSKMTARLGASKIQASLPWPSLKAFFLCLWPSPWTWGDLPTAVVVAIAGYLLLRTDPGATWRSRRNRCTATGINGLLDQALQLGLQLGECALDVATLL